MSSSRSPDGLALVFLEDDLVYSFNKVQESKDVQGVISLFFGKAPEDAGGDLLFPELNKSLRRSGLGYYQGYEYYSSFNCRWYPPYMDVAETAAILESSQTVEVWEKALCDQVIGSGLFPVVKGC